MKRPSVHGGISSSSSIAVLVHAAINVMRQAGRWEPAAKGTPFSEMSRIKVEISRSDLNDDVLAAAANAIIGEVFKRHLTVCKEDLDLLTVGYLDGGMRYVAISAEGVAVEGEERHYGSDSSSVVISIVAGVPAQVDTMYKLTVTKEDKRKMMPD